MAQGSRSMLSLGRLEEGTLAVRLAGSWLLQGPRPAVGELLAALQAEPRPQRVVFDSAALAAWDTGLLLFLVQVADGCRVQGVTMERDGLPVGLQRLLALAEAVPPPSRPGGPGRPVRRAALLEGLGGAVLQRGRSLSTLLAFLGETALSLGRLLTGRARMRGSDLAQQLRQAGPQALPVVSLVSFLIGAILAFMGAVQLQRFGAAIYVADLVAIAMVREMGAVMAAVVMAGRTGAAFAAELGTMKVTQEVDALATLGVPPQDFLVLPRLLALCVTMPLLALYADFLGILGGAAVGTGMLGLPWTVYTTQTVDAVSLGDLGGGLLKAFTYGVLVAVSGCLRGMQCGRDSAAVGEAATSAVVTGIVLIIVAGGGYAVLFYVLGI